MTTERAIVDAHCHVASFDHLPPSFIQGSVDNVMASMEAQGLRPSRSKVWDLYAARMQDHRCDELIAEMDAAGIATSVLLLADFTYALKDCRLTIAESFTRHQEILARHGGRLEVFAGVDPRWGQDGIDLFERSVIDHGFCGFKVYPPCGFSPSDRSLWPFYEICSDRGLPVVVHIGPTSPVMSFELANPFLVDAAAMAFPRVNFILAHGSVSFSNECCMLCRYRPNVYLDVSGFQMCNKRNGPRNPMRDIVSEGINHKVIFGTDWPIFRLGGTQHAVVQSLIGKDATLNALNGNEVGMIMGGNINRLLRRVSCPVAS